MSEKELFEQRWDIFVLTGMPWTEILSLSETDRTFMYEKSSVAKKAAMDQKLARDKYLADNNLNPDGSPKE